ncbi:putative thiazole-containing bacteriocin maturation protein [Kitasatospora viridis]|uniref:Putative thiazole-containing bacteriocin maturation protein n=2 Tax=Kitasatospora viridis TaxID=281105 RepID=A0A561TVM4_9ACTN|nr:putative thiazole-containing bacteriocin maturation protein [Kitasatospora viridis]
MRVPEGAYIRSNLGGSILKGASTYEWIQRIAPLLDGTKTLGELCASVPESSRAALAKLVLVLLGKGYVKNALEDRPHTLTAELTKAYAANIAFIEYFTDSPELRFEGYRDSRVVLAGSGPLLQALTNSQLRAGVRTCVLAPFAESPFDRDRVAEHLAAAQEQDPQQRIGYLDANAERLDLVAADADMVLHVTDRPMVERARLLPAAAVAAGAAFAQAVVAGDEAWIGPVIGKNDDPTAWESAWRRLCALTFDLAGADLADHPEAAPSEFLRGPTVALVANQLCFAAFRHLVGIDQGAGADRLVRFDLETLETATHAFQPHPLALPAVPDDPARLAALAAAAPVDDEELARRAVDCVDPRTGLFAEVTERDYEQLPLFVSEVLVSDPVGLAGGPFPVHGCGDSVIESRQRAVRHAFERYAAVMVDSRKGDRLTGLDVRTGEPVAVDAAQVFPARTAASGSDWPEAVRAAVVAAATEGVAAALSTATDPLPRLDLDGAELTERAARYRKLLEIVEESFEVHDLSALLGLPTFAFTTPQGTVAYTSDLEVCVALEQGLEQTLLAYQSRSADQPGYAPAPVPELPEHLRGETAARPVSVTLDEVVARLAGDGGRVVAVPLDHDPALARLCPFVVRAVVVHG